MQKRIKSYVLRAGRMSPRQQHALDQTLIHFELPQDNGVWDLDDHFGRSADVILDIGFGMGTSLLTDAIQHPERNYIGVEVHRAGIGSLVAELDHKNILNVRIAPFDVVEVVTTYLKDRSLAGVNIFFPDPWPKKRHHKRRLIQPDFIQLLTQKIKKGGFLHCATDWHDYAEHMLAVLSAAPCLKNQNEKGGFTPRPESRTLTKFEARGKALGHAIYDLVFISVG